MSNFVLIDLNSQADVFARHIKGWTVENVLDFMREFGEVRIIFELDNDKAYAFHSATGKRSRFRFTENGRLVI
jgi:rhodanese-related sulfurtransferase